MLKTFGEICEIKNEDEREKYSIFYQLNKIIERENITRDKLTESYIKILSGDNLDCGEELDYQVRYLLDNVGVSVNSILGFYDLKYSTLNNELFKSISDLSGSLSKRMENKILEFVNNKKKLLLLYVGFENEPMKRFLLDNESMSDEEIYNIFNSWINTVKEYNHIHLHNPTKRIIIGYS